jgi:hypothetical protein
MRQEVPIRPFRNSQLLLQLSYPLLQLIYPLLQPGVLGVLVLKWVFAGRAAPGIPRGSRYKFVSAGPARLSRANLGPSRYKFVSAGPARLSRANLGPSGYKFVSTVVIHEQLLTRRQLPASRLSAARTAPARRRLAP